MICHQMTNFQDGLLVERDGIVIALNIQLGLPFQTGCS